MRKKASTRQDTVKEQRLEGFKNLIIYPYY